MHSNRLYLIGLSLILFGLTLIMNGCGKERSETRNMLENRPQAPMVMVIKDQDDTFSQLVSDQILKILDYTKVPFFTVDLGIISQEFEIPQNVRSIIISTELVNELPANDLKEIVDYTSRGNSLVFAGPFSSEETSFLQGIRPDVDYTIDSVNTGVHLYKDIFPGTAGKTYDPFGASFHYGLKKNAFSNGIELIAGTATDPETPFIYSNEVGLGEVITINSYAINEKYYRGYLFAALLKGLKGIPYHVANVSTIFLDDFPAPLYNQQIAPIDKEYGLTHADFIANVWWPDMIAVADSFDINYSAMTAFNYNANVVPPFDFLEWQSGLISVDNDSIEGSVYLARDIVDSRHELAFHGYNHFSLVDEEWQNINFMISALQAARKRWRVDNLGELPTNYVPPTNQIDSIGMNAIVRGMPSIESMSSLYFGDVEFGGGREFDQDPYVPNRIFNYPRITSGFNMNDISLLDQQGLQLITGIWNHFIHPDDVFQVTQREDDEFRSRNPLGLGWRSDPTYGYGLYQLLIRRLEWTQMAYPMNRYVDATEGARRAEDWRRTFTHYSVGEKGVTINTAFRANYEAHYGDTTTYWYMYVPEDKVALTEDNLMKEGFNYDRTAIWGGFLYQFESDKREFTVPDMDESYYYDPSFMDNMVADQLQKYDRYNRPNDFFTWEGGVWRDTRLEDAVKAWKSNPSYANGEKLISLSLEFDQIERAIEVLENRLMNSSDWNEKDMNRLITYYGFAGTPGRAEQFIEKLWESKPGENVIQLKDLAVRDLGLYGEAFDEKWANRALELRPNDYQTLLTYTKAIESQDNWPEMKRNLRKLLKMRPDTDSLYAFTLQRSLYYDSPDSTVSLVEEFPASSYDQLIPFASNLALIYAYELGQYEQALFWADNVEEFDERTKLYWISEMGLKNLYLARARQMVLQDPENDSLRSFVGTNLFYEGFRDEAYEVMYPLFVSGGEQGFAADTLVRNEIGYMDYDQKKSFYKQYPAFFDDDQVQELNGTFRRTEGIRASVYGEYIADNFDNNRARGGASVQIGNRNKVTHLFRTEHLLLADQLNASLNYLNFHGLGYELGRKLKEQQIQIRMGGNLLLGDDELIPEALLSMSYSVDSTFSSLELTGGSVLTATALQDDHYHIKLQGYRQDYWANGVLSTAISTLSTYYTNSVFEYGGQLRLFYDPKQRLLRLRPLAEIAYADATKSYLSGIPYYTPDNYFSKGIGLEVQYRKPDNFDYRSLFSGEVMAKHEQRDGLYLTGRLQWERKFDSFWEIRLGTEFSTSKVYRSNRFFFTISHYFRNKLIDD